MGAAAERPPKVLPIYNMTLYIFVQSFKYWWAAL